MYESRFSFLVPYLLLQHMIPVKRQQREKLQQVYDDYKLVFTGKDFSGHNPSALFRERQHKEILR